MPATLMFIGRIGTPEHIYISLPGGNYSSISIYTLYISDCSQSLVIAGKGLRVCFPAKT